MSSLKKCILTAEASNLSLVKDWKKCAYNAELYDFYVQPIYRYVYFKVNKEDVLDITEGVFLKAWENLHTYKKGKASFSAWLFRIAHNLVVDHYRSHKIPDPLDTNYVDEKPEVNPQFLTERHLNQGNLKQAIAQLPTKYQQVILLKYVNDLDNEEISKIMDKSEGSLRILKFRALKALKNILNDMNIGY